VALRALPGPDRAARLLPLALSGRGWVAVDTSPCNPYAGLKLPPANYATVTLPREVYEEILAFRDELTRVGLRSLPEKFRPETISLGGIISAAIKSLKERQR